MDSNNNDRISRRAYELWEAAGRPHGQHDEHWLEAEREHETVAGDSGSAHGSATDTSGTDGSTTDPHPGMMGDGTEEQNLGQPGNPGARITEDEVQQAFADADKQD